MDDVTAELNERFAPANSKLAPDVVDELARILRLHGLEAEDLFYKWESYSIKLGAEDTELDLKTVRNFKRDIDEGLERENRDKQAKASGKKGGRSKGRDGFDMMEGVLPTTPAPAGANGVNGSALKRKGDFETPMTKGSRADKTPTTEKPFHERTNAGQVIEGLNHHLTVPDPPSELFSAVRIKLRSNAELSKFGYMTNAMKLSETSEVLDDRIDEFVELVKSHHGLEDGDFGNAAARRPDEIVAVGRIACDSPEGRLNSESIVLETSRRSGGGLRVPLKVDTLSSYRFFPGQIVALRGTNASGAYFAVREMLALPSLAPAASLPTELDGFNAGLGVEPDTPDGSGPIKIILASGPYTTSTALDFAPFHALLDAVFVARADVLILNGPFLDTEHPAIRTGSFAMSLPTAPGQPPIDPDTANLTTVFRHLITAPLTELARKLPSLVIILAPSVRDAISKHAAWPQERFVKRDLGLPKTANCVTDPVTISLNEILAGICSIDPLDALRRSEIAGGDAKKENMLTRLPRSLVEQRCFYPVFPPPARDSGLPLEKADEDAGDMGEDAAVIDWQPVGTMMDPAYLKLADWLNAKPDLLIVPSVLTPFVKVVESVIVVNPGTLSKRRGPGTYARMTVFPLKVTNEMRGEEGENLVPHKLYERARVDIVRI